MKNKSIFKSMALALMVAGAFIVSACTDYSDDIDKVNQRVDNLEKRFTSVEEIQNNMNSNLTALTQIVNNISNGGYVEGIAETEDGYTLTFSNGKTVSIHQGKDGKDGKDGVDGKDGKDGADGKDGTDGKDGKDGVDGKDGADGQNAVIPVISIKQDTDGNWYWTLDDESSLWDGETRDEREFSF